MSEKISCKQAVNLLSKKEEGKLMSGQRFKLWRHLEECSLCRIFSMQNKILTQAFAQGVETELTPAEKETIVRAAVDQDSKG